MNRWSITPVAIFLCVALAGCRTRPVSLTGTYGVVEGKSVEPALRITETRTGYLFEERTVGEWLADPEIPHVATADEVKRSLGTSAVDFPVFGLATAKAILLKVRPGWRTTVPNAAQSMREVVATSGYLLVSSGETFAAQKVELSGR